MLIFKSLYSRELLYLLESSEGGKLRVNQLSTRCAHILEKKSSKDNNQLDFCSHTYSHLSNKRGGWNKRERGAKFAKLLNVEVGINVEGGILWKKQCITLINEEWRVEKI